MDQIKGISGRETEYNGPLWNAIFANFRELSALLGFSPCFFFWCAAKQNHMKHMNHEFVIRHMNRFPQDLARTDTTAQEVEGGRKNEEKNQSNFTSSDENHVFSFERLEEVVFERFHES